MPNNKYPMVVSYLSSTPNVAAFEGSFLRTKERLHVTYQSEDHAAFLLYLSGVKDDPKITEGALRFLDDYFQYNKVDPDEVQNPPSLPPAKAEFSKPNKPDETNDTTQLSLF